jgi:hypothetical protein
LALAEPPPDADALALADADALAESARADETRPSVESGPKPGANVVAASASALEVARPFKRSRMCLIDVLLHLNGLFVAVRRKPGLRPLFPHPVWSPLSIALRTVGAPCSLKKIRAARE